MERLFTIGHSTYSTEHFARLLQANNVTAVADVRSIPASKYAPQYNRESLRRSLRSVGVKYVFLGKELGARSDDPECYVDGRVQYSRLAQTSAFADGIKRLRSGARTESIAIMCTEQDPLDCHRCILVSVALLANGVEVDHILGDGKIETHAEAMSRLRANWHLAEVDLFNGPQELLAEALRKQEAKIAYVNPDWLQEQMRKS